MSSMLNISSQGDFKKLEKFLKNSNKDTSRYLDQMGVKIVNALKGKTPTRSGKTANSWFHRISNENGNPTLEICNSNVNGNVNIAIIIHYGHGTGTGGYVPPRPYIKDTIDSTYKAEIDQILKNILQT